MPVQLRGGFKMLKSFLLTHFFEGLSSNLPPHMFQCPVSVTFTAATGQSNIHMLLLISAKSRLQLCHREFPPVWALTGTRWLTDEAQPAPVCQTPPLSPALCLTTSALHYLVAMQEKTHFFCSLFQPIRKWNGGSFLFPVFPRQYRPGPSSPVRFPPCVL